MMNIYPLQILLTEKTAEKTDAYYLASTEITNLIPHDYPMRLSDLRLSDLRLSDWKQGDVTREKKYLFKSVLHWHWGTGK